MEKNHYCWGSVLFGSVRVFCRTRYPSMATLYCMCSGTRSQWFASTKKIGFSSVPFRFSYSLFRILFGSVLPGFEGLTVLLFPQWLLNHSIQHYYMAFLWYVTKSLKTRNSSIADKPARRVYRSVKVTKHSTIPYVIYSFLLCNSNFVFKTIRFYDIQLQKCYRDLENQLGSVKVIANITMW